MDYKYVPMDSNSEKLVGAYNFRARNFGAEQSLDIQLHLSHGQCDGGDFTLDFVRCQSGLSGASWSYRGTWKYKLNEARSSKKTDGHEKDKKVPRSKFSKAGKKVKGKTKTKGTDDSVANGRHHLLERADAGIFSEYLDIDFSPDDDAEKLELGDFTPTEGTIQLIVGHESSECGEGPPIREEQEMEGSCTLVVGKSQRAADNSKTILLLRDKDGDSIILQRNY